jgi:ribonuclease HI
MQGWVKCNTNGDLIPQNQSAACGGVFRDESGAWRGGFVRNIGTCSALMSELWGILFALQVAKEKGFNRIMFESDPTIAVYLIVKGCPSNHPCSSIVTRIDRLKMQDLGGVLSSYLQAGKPGC